MIIFQLQFSFKDKVNNIVHTTWEIVFMVDNRLQNWNSQRKVLCGAKCTLYNDLFKVKLCCSRISLKKILLHCNMVQDHTMWISIWLTYYLKHSVLTIKYCSFKMIAFCSFQAPILNYYNFWSRNATKILEKAKKAISRQ